MDFDMAKSAAQLLYGLVLLLNQKKIGTKITNDVTPWEIKPKDFINYATGNYKFIRKAIM